MEIKIVCDCGQKYSFDVEPVGGRMPSRVACPSCGRDGTESANNFLAQQFPNQAPPIPVAVLAQPAVAPPPKPAIRISQAQLAAAPAGAPPLLATPGPITPMAVAGARTAAGKAKKSGEYSLGMGVVGAFLGAGLGAALMLGFYMFAHFKFPFMGTCVGALTGFGARTLARGTDSTLGGIAAAIALVATGGSLYLMYGAAAGMLIVTMVVSVIFAWRIAG